MSTEIIESTTMDVLLFIFDEGDDMHSKRVVSIDVATMREFG